MLLDTSARNSQTANSIIQIFNCLHPPPQLPSAKSAFIETFQQNFIAYTETTSFKF